MNVDFAEPQWFALTLVLPFLAGLKLWSQVRAARAVDGIVAKRLQPDLVHRMPGVVVWLVFGLQILAILCFIATMARPQWGFRDVETMTEGRNVFLALDTSRSMLAEDLKPNRLTRAKLAAQDLVRNLPTDRIGVIAFAGRPFIQAPLTVDHEAVLESLNQLDVEVIPRGGTNLTGPAVLALQTMQEAETSLAALVIFSDGEDHEGAAGFEQLVKAANDSRLLIVTVGVGTEAGAIIPDPSRDGRFIEDDSGQVVRSRLDSMSLRRLSDLTNGVFLNMGGDASVTAVVQDALRKLETQRLQADEVRVPIERYYIPLMVGMGLLILSYVWPFFATLTWRRTVRQPRETAMARAALLIIPLAGFGRVTPAQAADTALEVYRNGNYEEAQEFYTRQMTEAKLAHRRYLYQFGAGAAAFRVGDFETAKASFSEALLSHDPAVQEQSHFNLGNALFETGRLLFPTDRPTTRKHWESALAHYAAALELNEANPRTRVNRDFVQQLLDDMKEDEPPPDEDENEDEPEDDENQQDPPPDENQQDPPPDQNQDENQDPNQDPEDPGEDPQDQPPPGTDPKEPPPGNEPPDPGDQQPQEPPPGQPGEDQSPPPQGQSPPPGNREWSPSEARRILENNADEDKDAKPVTPMKFTSEPFKNW